VQTRPIPRIDEPLVPVVAELCYLKRSSARPYNYLYARPDDAPSQNWECDRRPVQIADARQLAPSIDREGFELRDAPTTTLDFDDESQVRSRYYPEVTELALQVTGASEAHVFDHLVRRHRDDLPTTSFGRRGRGSQPGPAAETHNDYTEESGQRRLRLVLKDFTRTQSIKRHGIVNIWRSIAGPVHDAPLALADARTVAPHDLVRAELHYPKRVGEIYLLQHSGEQRWYYFSEMDCHEALIFKQYDSLATGVARFTPHAAFAHPLAPPNARKRESIEVRCLVVYE
jgi:hypothetical protein